MRLFQKTIVAGTVLLIAGCSANIEEDRRRFPSISEDRRPGTVCTQNDLASVKRAAMHPLGPTGGWLNAGNNRVDYSRKMKLGSNCLVMRDGCISGYVKFDSKGHLQARSYDDVYGDVYCGWSPYKLELNPSSDFVYVSLSICSVGDGGLDQVHEVCWFPEGKKDGVIVFSTAHCDRKPVLGGADLYRPDLLGGEYQFNDRLAFDAISDNLKRGDTGSAASIIADCEKVLSRQRDAVDGSTGKPIPAKEMSSDQWAMVQAFKLGLSINDTSFDTNLEAICLTVNGPHRGGHMKCDTYANMLPVYSWLSERVRKRKTGPLTVKLLQPGLVGHEPITIAEYLQSDKPDHLFLKEVVEGGEFWVGVKHFLKGELEQGDLHFCKFLKEPNSASLAFEMAAAAKFLKMQSR